MIIKNIRRKAAKPFQGIRERNKEGEQPARAFKTCLLCAAASSLCGGETVGRKKKSSFWDHMIAFLLRVCQFRSDIKVRGFIPETRGEIPPPPPSSNRRILPPSYQFLEICQKSSSLELAVVLFCSAADKVCGGSERVDSLRRGSCTRLVYVCNRIPIYKRDEADTSYYKSLSPCHLEGWAHANECN